LGRRRHVLWMHFLLGGKGMVRVRVGGEEVFVAVQVGPVVLTGRFHTGWVPSVFPAVLVGGSTLPDGLPSGRQLCLLHQPAGVVNCPGVIKALAPGAGFVISGRCRYSVGRARSSRRYSCWNGADFQFSRKHGILPRVIN
jgi:hypothetical protein